MNLIHVGQVFLVKNDADEITGVEVGFTENVTGKKGACFVLDSLRNSMWTSGWVTQTIMRVGDADAQTDEGADEGSDTDTESVAGESSAEADAQ